MRLQGKRAVVTAAGAGIGQATAIAFAAQGAEVIATDINADTLGPVADAGCTVHTLDVTDGDAITRFAAQVGAPDILFNCAGFVHHGTILDCDDDAFDFSFNLNVRSMFRVTRAFLPAMIGNGGGSIVNMASVVSVTPTDADSDALVSGRFFAHSSRSSDAIFHRFRLSRVAFKSCSLIAFMIVVRP